MASSEQERKAYEVMNKRFAKGSQEVLITGHNEMRQLGHRNFSTGHLLLRLMQNGLASEVLSRYKLDLGTVRAAVKELTIDDESLPAGDLTLGAKKVIEEAINEQRVDGSKVSSSLHLLRGFMSLEMQFRSLLRGEPSMTISKKLGLDPGVIFDQAKKLSFEEDGSPIDEDLHFDVQAGIQVFLNPAPRIRPQQQEL